MPEREPPTGAGGDHAMAPPRQVTLRAYGHPQIRSTHHKSLEVTTETEITGRATCVVGVGTAPFPDALHLLRGPVRITITAGDRALAGAASGAASGGAAGVGGAESAGAGNAESAGGGAASLTGRAVINPDHAVTHRVVVRRSDRADPDTLAVAADFAADDLTPYLRTELGRAGAPVLITVAEEQPPPPLVVLGNLSAPPAGRAGRLWQHADAAVRLDNLSPAGSGQRGGAVPPAGGAQPTSGPSGREHALRTLARGGTVAAAVGGPLDRLSGPALRWLHEAVRYGARLLASGGDADTLALLAAGVPPTPALRLGIVDRRAARSPVLAGLLRNGVLPAVLTVSAEDSEAVLGLLRTEQGPPRQVAVPTPGLDVGVALRWSPVADAVAGLAGAGSSAVTVVVAPRGDAGASVDPADLARALIGAGVAPRTVAEALAPWGIGRREVYAWRQPGGPAAGDA